MSIKPVITIDGPSGVGKGTLALKLAKALDWDLLDSGAIYRALAFYADDKGVDLENEEKVATLALNLPLAFQTSEKEEGQAQAVHVFLEGQEVTSALRQESIGNKASIVAKLPLVRENLLQRQRDFLPTQTQEDGSVNTSLKERRGLVADGRDMGTIIFPKAPLKIFLTASSQVRAERRYKELLEKGFCVKIEQILSEVEARDERDRTRTSSPLIPAEDAIIIDTSVLTINEVFKKVWQEVERVGFY